MAAKRHRVVYLLDRVGGGGIAQVVINTATNLDRDRFEPVVCLSREADKMDHGRRLADAGVELVELGRTSARQLGPWRTLLPYLREATILHSHGEMTNHWARLWSTIARTPILITHDHTAADEKSPLSRRLDRRTAFLADAIVSVSAFDRQRTIELEGHRPDKVHTIYNGIDVTRFADRPDDPAFRESLGVPPGATCVSMIARLAPQKNHRLALDAVTRLPDRLRKDLHLLLVGEGPLEPDLRSLVDRLDLTDQVSFLGQRPDVPRILAATDVLYLPSRWECLPMIALEAMAAGCAMVASPVGGIPEILDGVGWPLASADDVDVTASALAEVLDMEPGRRSELVALGRARIEAVFSAEVSARNTAALYERLMAAEGLS